MALVFIWIISIIAVCFVTSEYSPSRGNHGNLDTEDIPGVREAFQMDNQTHTLSWTHWTTWSTCTKTCGFGISIRNRDCVQKNGSKTKEISGTETRKRSGCQGVFKEIQTCNTQLCPTGIATPREFQCQEFNNKAFMGRQYQWEPFINPEGKCELTCRAKGFRFYARLAATVADGTPCMPGSTDVCIAGDCQKVGCDGIVGSSAKMDVCGKCRGDNSTCNVKSGTFTTETLTQGYNTVLEIPKGATNINISEIKSSSNFLALKTSENAYILNGPRDLSSVGEYFGAGTKFTYKKNEETWCPGQCFLAAGPTDKALEVQILFYRRNPGLRYRYSVPKNNHKTDVQEKSFPDSPPGYKNTDLNGYVSDSQEIQNDGRPTERQTSYPRHHRRPHIKNKPVHLPKYSQSFTFGKSSMINDRYRHLAHNKNIKSHRSAYPDTRNRHESHTSLRERTDHHTTHSHNKLYNEPATTGARRLEDHHRQTHRQTDPSTSSHFRQNNQNHRQTDSRREQTDVRRQQYKTHRRQSKQDDTRLNLHRQQQEIRRRQIEERRRQIEARRREIHLRSLSTNERQSVSRSAQDGESSRQSLSQPSKRVYAPDYPLSYNQNLNIRKEPLYLNRQSGSNRALSLTTDSLNRSHHPNRLPSPTRASSRDSPQYNRNGYLERTDGRQIDLVDKEYSWKISGLTDCSEQCGGGYQHSVLVCVKKSSQVVVTDENCEHTIRPDTHTVICNQQPCPAKWEPSDWSSCTVSCGGGLQSREVTCKRRISPDLTIAVSADQCSGEVRPAVSQHCGQGNCFQWSVGNWSKCSAPCGKGERTRDVVCQSIDGSDATNHDCLRSARKPENKEVCDLGSCGTGWYYTLWSNECPASCGEGLKKRSIHCAGPHGDTLPAAKCKQFQKPEETQKCKTDIPCGGQWFSGPWEKCSTECGAGIQTRDVVCMKKLNTNFFTAVEEENCAKEGKPEVSRSCSNQSPCRPEWYMKDWTSCSASCGSGYRTREVKCLDSVKKSSPDCLQEDKPVTRESCNTQSCHSLPTDDSCKDSYSRCRLVVRSRLCRYSYYKKVCCQSCSESGQLK